MILKKSDKRCYLQSKKVNDHIPYDVCPHQGVKTMPTCTKDLKFSKGRVRRISRLKIRGFKKGRAENCLIVS